MDNKNDDMLPEAPSAGRAAKPDSLIKDGTYYNWDRMGKYPLIQKPNDGGYLEDVIPKDIDFFQTLEQELFQTMESDDCEPEAIDINDTGIKSLGDMKKSKRK